MIESTGPSLSGRVSMDASRSFAHQRCLPFEAAALDGRVLNGETHRALSEADAKDAGIIEDDAYAFVPPRMLSLFCATCKAVLC